MQRPNLVSNCCNEAKPSFSAQICPACRDYCHWIEVDDDGNPIQDEPTDDQHADCARTWLLRINDQTRNYAHL